MRRLILTAALLAALAAAVPAQGATVRVQRFTGFDDVPIVNSALHYRLRLSYVVPATWHQRGRAHGLFRRFGPIGSCRFTVRVLPEVLGEFEEPVASRVERELPGTGSRLLDAGTRGNGAWRVVRTSGSSRVTGLLVRPAPSTRTRFAPGVRVWLELRLIATAHPRRDCHTGVTRTVGAQIGDALATAAIGGFQL